MLGICTPSSLQIEKKDKGLLKGSPKSPRVRKGRPNKPYFEK